MYICNVTNNNKRKRNALINILTKIVMNTKILVIEGNSFEDLLEGVVNALCDDKPKKNECKHKNSCSHKERWAMPRWDICTTLDSPAEDSNKRFGAGFEIDEPRAEDYDERWMFESDHAAFDRFVDAGEDCVARGMAKKSDAPIHKVNAIRKRVEDGPVFGVDLIGETHWW